MFKGIFDKSGAGHKGEGQGAPAAPASAKAASSETQAPAQMTPVLVDETTVVISRELSGLAQLPVAQAARERGWATLQRELERHPVAATGARSTGRVRPAKARRWRWALASAAAAVAVIATLIGTYSGGLLQTAGNDDPTGTVTSVTSVVSSDTTEPSTTVSTEGTTVSTDGPRTTQAPATTTVQPGTTQSPSTTGTQPTTPTSSGPTHTTGTGGDGGNTTTTRPASTTTTGEQQYTSAEREGSARAAALYLAELVTTGNTSGARQLVAAGAQGSLAQMMMSLNEPTGYGVSGVVSLTGSLVRVSLDIDDRVIDGRGELVETVKHFWVRVQVDNDGATVVAINAGS